MASFIETAFLVLAALGLVVLMGEILRRALRAAAAPRRYRRSAAYATNGRPEFEVYGIGGQEDIETFLRFLHRKYRVRVLDKDPDPDELSWKVGRRKDWVEIHYSDHLGLRVRAADKKGAGLFAKMLEDFET